MKRSTQWDLAGVFALFSGFAMLVTFFYGLWASIEPTTPITRFIIVYGNPFVAVFAVAWSFMCFIFGFLEGKKEEQRQFTKARPRGMPYLKAMCCYCKNVMHLYFAKEEETPRLKRESTLKIFATFVKPKDSFRFLSSNSLET